MAPLPLTHMATFADLKRQTLSYIRRMPDDASIPVTLLEGAINRQRREAWRKAGGQVPDTITLNVVSGRRDYPVTGPVAAVSYKSGSTADTVRLIRLTPSALLNRYPRLPDTGVPEGIPECFVVRPTGDPTSVDALVYDALLAPGASASGTISISLYPTPSASVTGGLLVDCEGPASELSGDDAVSELPEAVDTAACWMAALELLAFVSHEPEALQVAAYIKAQARDASAAAFEATMDLLAEWETIGPSVSMGVDPVGESTIDGSTFTETLSVSASQSVSATVASVTIDCSANPPASGYAVAAFSVNEGFVANAVISGNSIVVTADVGMSFDAGDVVYVFYSSLRT